MVQPPFLTIGSVAPTRWFQVCFLHFSTGSGRKQLQTEWKDFSNQNQNLRSLGAWNWTSQVLEKIWFEPKFAAEVQRARYEIWVCPPGFPQRFCFWSALGMLHFHMGVSSCWQVRASSRLKINSWQHGWFLSFVLIKTIKFNFLQHIPAITPEILSLRPMAAPQSCSVVVTSSELSPKLRCMIATMSSSWWTMMKLSQK